MKIALTAIVTCALALADANGQQEQAKVSDITGRDSLEVALRVLQYEILLGTELRPLVAVCIDQSHRTSWMLPGNAETEVSAKAIERIRRTAEICQATAREREGESEDLRLASNIRASLESQLKAAQALEVSKRNAQNCISQSKTESAFKACMAAALPNSTLDALWPKWLSIFGRSISIAASAPSANR